MTKHIGFTITETETVTFRHEFVYETETRYELYPNGWVYSERTRRAYHDWSDWSEWTALPDSSWVPDIANVVSDDGDWKTKKEVSWMIDKES